MEQRELGEGVAGVSTAGHGRKQTEAISAGEAMAEQPWKGVKVQEEQLRSWSQGHWAEPELLSMAQHGESAAA